jgi:hypothetical protein
MKRLSLAAFAGLLLLAQGPRPSCDHCSASYISAAELNAYLDRAPKLAAVTGVSDQQVRAVDIGKMMSAWFIARSSSELRPSPSTTS